MRSLSPVLTIVLAVSLSACSGGSSKLPTSPTTALRVTPDSGTGGPISATGTVSWACFANGGVAQAAFGAAGCPPRITTLHLASTTVTPLAVAPNAPTAFNASASGSVVTLNWTAPATGDPPTSYVIEAGSASGRIDIAVFDTGSNATSLAVFNVPAGTYFVRVRAVNSAGASPASNEVQLVVAGPAPCTTLLPPTALTGGANGSTITLTWAAPAGCAPTGYIIQAGSSTGLSNLANFSTGSTATSFTATGVGAGSYFIRVLSSGNNLVSVASNEVVVTVGGCGVVPNAPQNLRASASGGTVTVAWDPPVGGCAPASYVLEAGSSSGATDIAVTTVNGTSLTATNVGNGTYFIRIRAVNALGQSAASNEVALTVGGPAPPVPLVVGFQFFDPSTQAAATTSCRILSASTSSPSTCEARSTSFATGTNAIVLYEWTAQYFYGTSKTVTQSGTNPVFAFGDTCGGPGATDTGADQALSVTLTVTDSLGNKATAASGTGSQPPLTLKLFKC